MSRDRASLVYALFEGAREVPVGQRDAWLSGQEAPAVVLAEVRALLAAMDSTAEHAASPLTHAALHFREGAGRAVREFQIPEVIGSYRVLSVIGQGGMGVVYLAEQSKPERRVALKVILPRIASERMLKRFEYEAEVLGRLLHPGIAQIYEANTADLGAGPQPFFAMEYVEGQALNSYASVNELGTRERLDVFARICDAVEHAHQKGVIHRDLKPANILVTAEGQPKILDFGVARTTDSDLQATTMQTDFGQLVGTLPYMSPEQVSGDPTQLDTRSDVYALGVVLYELLTGRLPYVLEQQIPLEAARIIREDAPTRLSSINRSLRGDVETIVAHALEKDRSRRYQAASMLAADVRHYLNNEPIDARPASTWYQLSTFGRRNRGLVAGVLVAFTALLCGSVATGLALWREREQRHNAQAAAAGTESAFDFMINVFGTADPWSDTPESTTVADAIERVASSLESGTINLDELNLALLHDAIGSITANVGDPERAVGHLTRALDIRRRHLSATDPRLATSLHNLADIQVRLGHSGLASGHAAEALAIRRVCFPNGGVELVSSLLLNETVCRDAGNDPLANSLLEEALDLATNTWHGDHPELAECLNVVGRARRDEGRYKEAEVLLTESLEMRKRLYVDHPDIATALNELAVLYYKTDRLEDAQRAFEEVVDLHRRVHPQGHYRTGVGLSNLASVLEARGSLAKALLVYQEAVDMLRRAYPSGHQTWATIAIKMADLLRETGGASDAETHYRGVLAYYVATDTPVDDELYAMHGLVTCLCDLNRYAEAHEVATRALTLCDGTVPTEHPVYKRCAQDLARAASLMRGSEGVHNTEPAID